MLLLLLQRIVKVQNLKTWKKEKFSFISDSVTRKTKPPQKLFCFVIFFLNKEVDFVARI